MKQGPLAVSARLFYNPSDKAGDKTNWNGQDENFNRWKLGYSDMLGYYISIWFLKNPHSLQDITDLKLWQKKSMLSFLNDGFFSKNTNSRSKFEIWNIYWKIKKRFMVYQQKNENPIYNYFVGFNHFEAWSTKVNFKSFCAYSIFNDEKKL